MDFYSTDVGGLSLKVSKTEAGWEASIAGPASLMNLETAQRAAEKRMNWYGVKVSPQPMTQESATNSFSAARCCCRNTRSHLCNLDRF